MKIYTGQQGYYEFDKALKKAFREEYIKIYITKLDKLKGLTISEKERIKLLLNSDLEEDYVLGEEIIDMFKK